MSAGKEALVGKEMPNIVRYFNLKKGDGGDIELEMEKLEDPVFSAAEKEVIGRFFGFVERRIVEIRKEHPEYLEFLDFEEIFGKLKEHYSEKIREFTGCPEAKNYFQDALSCFGADGRIHKVLGDAFIGIRSLLTNGVAPDDLKAEHVMYSENEDAYKLIDII
ncbi:hypothetical protein JW899_00765 [Candidatus Uhrbacteria bacterium]|nr:hypothetical protein [Candidatus Uhrbacteria bacterium]